MGADSGTGRDRATGQTGEAIAAAYLERQGYRVEARNWHCPLGEIDLVATDDAYRVFVEVKTRSRSGAYHPTLNVTAAKRRRLRELGAQYLAALAEQAPAEAPAPPLQPRFDVIAVVLDGTWHRPRDGTPAGEAGAPGTVEHYIDAF